MPLVLQSVRTEFGEVQEQEVSVVRVCEGEANSSYLASVLRDSSGRAPSHE